MNISTTDARALFTKMFVDVYRERTTPTSFLRSFFKVKEGRTKEVSIEVQRGTEMIAVDVERGTEGNRNKFSKSTEKIFVPPYYREYFDATELDLYDRMFGDGEIELAVFNEFINTVADKYRLLVDKIERAYELQCSQVFETGIVTLVNGDNIDFKRKPASKVDKGAGAYWATGTVSPYVDLENGCIFMRQKGKAQGGVFNAILGSEAFKALMDNTIFKAANNLFNLRLDSVVKPQRESVGGTLHGQITCGSYLVNLWTYPEYYDTATTTNNSYINPKKVIMLPEDPRFALAFAAVPRLLTKAGSVPQKGAYIFGDYVDERDSKHIFDVKSAGVAIPVGVDQIYTVQVVA